jgi:hypothetical protein
MKEYKIRQDIFYRQHTGEFDDNLNTKDVIVSDDIVDNAIRYFTSTDQGWIYPAKSYAVAILYAMWIQEEFGEDFYEVLDDPELLYNNDPYFVPYSHDQATYDSIIYDLPQDMTGGMIPDIRRYFEEEFLLNAE